MIVLAHNGCSDTLSCLASLAGASWARLTVVLVDNGSTDGTAETVRRLHPGVSVIRLEDNRGFSEGNNVGARHALAIGADYIFLLNNDTTVAGDAIARCVATARTRPDVGAVCPLIYFADPPTLIWYAGADFDPERARSGRVLGYRELDAGELSHSFETPRATGAAVLMPRHVVEQVGLLDPELFFLYEDVDWSLRARRAGYRLYVEPKAKVWHRVSASSGGEHSTLIAYYDTRNHIVVCQRHASAHGLSAVRREVGLLVIHLAGARRARQRLGYVRAVLEGWADARRGRLGPRT